MIISVFKDEQVALKKKLKETLEAESRYHQRQAIDTVKRCLEKGQNSYQVKVKNKTCLLYPHLVRKMLTCIFLSLSYAVK